MKIVKDDLSGEAIAAFLREHLKNMERNSPPGCVYALDLDGLRARDVTFWSIWEDESLLGCGALKELNARQGEVKSMRTASAHLRQGIGGAMLRHLIDVSRERGYSRLSLETGSGPAFAAADALYRTFGFDYCGPFGDYRENTFSRFMTLTL
ncbi:MAG: GNAT family N-acetyltransferase [Woeseiaceae bacterium]